MLKLLRGGGLSKDSACSDKSRILRWELGHYHLGNSLRSHLENRNFSSTILESQSSNENYKSNREEAESNEQSPDFSSTILESLFLLSLRALRGKAWQSPLCHCEPMKSAWQSIKSIQPYTKSLESIFQKVDSRGNALLSPFLWLIGLTPRSFMSPLLLAPYNNFSKTNTLFTTAETMDCHADKSARNDRNNATFQSIASLEKADSRSKAQPTHHDSKHCRGALHPIPKPKTPQAAGFLMKKPTPKSSKNNAQSLSEQAQDSRISKETSACAERYPLFCDEKCGLQGKSQGSCLDGNDRRDFSPLPHLSRKAESSKNTQSHF